MDEEMKKFSLISKRNQERIKRHFAEKLAVEKVWPNILVNGKFKIKWSRVKKENGWDVKCYITNGLGERREFDGSLIPPEVQRPWPSV